MRASAPVSVRASPAADSWGELALRRFRSRTENQLTARAELGLPTDRPVIMTGHQAGFWHPGILAKYIAADRLAEAVGGVAAAVVVDHDVVDPLRVEAVRLRVGGGVEATTIHLRARSGKAMVPRMERPVGERELLGWRGSRSFIDGDDAALRAIVWALERHASGESLGEQVARANADLLSGWVSVESFTAQRLVRTNGWKRFFERAVEDPAGCARAYNRAVARHPEGGTPPLFAMAREYRWELPFWLLDRGRRPLYAEMVEQEGFASDLLAPRALSLTASLRRELCDLFIHGTGGAVYDRATDAWISEWLGEDLAPVVAITADVYRAIPVEARREATEQDLARAHWMVHSARHNPELLGDEPGAREKRAMVKRIDRARRGSAERFDLYRQMHSGLEAVRDRGEDALEGLEANAAAVEQGLVVRGLEAKRDWASVLYPPEQLDRLSKAIEGMLSPATRR